MNNKRRSDSFSFDCGGGHGNVFYKRCWSNMIGSNRPIHIRYGNSDGYIIPNNAN